jgi:hypothetical protein
MTNEAFSRVKVESMLRHKGLEITNADILRFECVLPDRTNADDVLYDRNRRLLAIAKAVIYGERTRA